MPKTGEKPALKALESVEIMGFELLNDDKVARALDHLGETASEEEILSEYDKLAGGIKKDGRKVALGSFYDFVLKKPRTDVKFNDLDYEDELVVVRKAPTTRVARGEDVKDRVTRVTGGKKLAAKAPTSSEKVVVAPKRRKNAKK